MMGTTGHRYAIEQVRLELALRMIGHEARTCTIRSCTGLSDDRIRRLYSVYFKTGQRPLVRRQRGKSPRRTQVYVKNVSNQFEASMLAVLFASFDLLAFDTRAGVHCPIPRRSSEYGNLFCEAYEVFVALWPEGKLGFERAWTLLESLVDGTELRLLACRECRICFVHHILEIDDGRCPCCKLKGIQPTRRRNLKPGLAAHSAAARRVPAAFLPRPPAHAGSRK